MHVGFAHGSQNRSCFVMTTQ